MLIAYRTINEGEELTIAYGYDDFYENCECNDCVADIESP